MKVTLWPKSDLGKWSARLSIAFIILISLKIMNAAPMPTFTIAILGLVGFFMGIVAMIKNKERSIPIFLSIVVGLLIIFWTVAEFIYPH